MIKYAISNPVKVLVFIFFISLFGLQSLIKMPYRLIPSIESPQISINTYWRGASPYEIEKEIIDRQERALKTIPGLIDCESSARESVGYITLMFDINVPVYQAILLVSNKLKEISGYPDNINEPIVKAANTDSVSVIDLMLVTTEDNPKSIEEYLSYFEEVIKPYIDRVEGVADLSYWGGRAKQMQIKVDPYRLSSYNISLSDIISSLSQESVNISGGTLDFGTKDYRFRVVGEAKNPEDLRGLVVITNDSAKIKLGDIADVDYGFSKPNTIVSYDNRNALSIGVIAQSDTSILELTNRVEEVTEALNSGILEDKGLKLIKMSDQKQYILNAISLVRSNLIIGGVLAIFVLLLFLRNIRSTLIVAVTIPFCLAGSILVLHIFGKSLNVISLAGLAFSVGMLIDNSIVMLENIDRHMKMGKDVALASLDGAKEVWGAILASSLTTVAVFLPVIFIKAEIGQLFAGISLAITSAILFSLVASVLIIPSFANLIFSIKLNKLSEKNIFINHLNKFIEVLKAKFLKLTFFQKINFISLAAFLVRFGNRIADYITNISLTINKKTSSRLILIFILFFGSISSAYFLIPQMDYLPLGNKNLLISRYTPPPGISYEERKKMSDYIYKELQPYMQKELNGYPQISDYSFVASTTYVAVQVTSKDPLRVAELRPLLVSISKNIPGIVASTTQAPLFNVGRGSSNMLIMNVTSNADYNSLIDTVQLIQARILEAIPNIQLRTNPIADPVYPEVQILPRREALKAAGVTARELGISVDAYLDGRKIGEFKDPEIGTIDIILKGYDNYFKTQEDVYSILVASQNNLSVPISNLADIKELMGLDRIRRYNYQRSFAFLITLPDKMVLEELKERIQNDVILPMKSEGLLENTTIYTSGASSKLEQAKKALSSNFILAVLITYLLMAALLNNFLYPIIILFSVPLAAMGGFVGLKLANILVATQSLDVITMLGFIILVGSVVNNPILIIYQTLNNIEYGMSGADALKESLRSRIRPIFMSALTSVFGMLPLVLSFGEGSELYRGMGSVMLSGLLISTIFTLFLIPAILSFFVNKKPIARK